MTSNFQFIKSIINTYPVPIMAVSIDNLDLLFSSSQIEKVLGYSFDELSKFSKNNFREIIHPDDINNVDKVYHELLASSEGQILKVQYRIKKSTGNYLHWLETGTVFERDQNDKPLKFSSIIEDITALVNLQKKLEGKVNIIQRISYRNSHDLRGPVASIIGLLQLIKIDECYSKCNKDIFTHLENMILKLDDIIKEISDISNHEL